METGEEGKRTGKGKEMAVEGGGSVLSHAFRRETWSESAAAVSGGRDFVV
jgi:hypothetical protein